MNHYFKSVIPVIESNYNKFTTVEKSIADFFINNQKKADFSGINSVCELTTLKCYYHNVAKAETEASGVFKGFGIGYK